MPFLSVVIPTRQRPELLAFALESALNQTGYDDYEVVVSVNGRPDETRAVVERFDSSRISYHETGEDLQHQQSWHFAAGKCEAEYMLLLADDAGLLPDAMSRYAATLQRYGNPDYLSPANAWYGHDSVSFPRKNALRFRWQWTSEGMAEPRQMLTSFFAFQHPTFTPTYSLTSTWIRGQLEDRCVNPYLVPYPDYGMQACALSVARTACLMREPTIVHGYASDSGGEISFGRREQVAWTPPEGDESIFKHVPLHGHNFINGWAETLLRARALLPDLLEEFEPDWHRYYFTYAQELVGDGEWRDITADFVELCKTLKDCPEPVRVPLLSAPDMIYTLDRLKRIVTNRLWDVFDLDFRQDWINGDQYGFSNIVECSRVASELFERQQRNRTRYYVTVPPK